MEALNLAAGFGVGLLVGITGVGGGALMTPLLVLVAGASPSVAIGTDLWFAAITKLVGGGVHGSRGGVDWQVARRLWAGSLPASALVLVWMHTQDAHRIGGVLLNWLGGVLLLTAIATALKKPLHAWGRRLRLSEPGPFKRVQPAGTVLAGAVLGALVTLTSVGAGALGAVFLLALYPLRMVPARLVGTDIVHAVPLTLLAGLGHLWLGHVDWALLGQLLAGSLPGILLGTWVGSRLPEVVLRTGIAAVLAMVGIRLLA